MKLFRLVVLLWLSLSVPTAALASVVSAEHCQRGKPAAGASAHAQHAMHAGMSMQGEHAQHMAHAGQQAKVDNSHCSCGCNCSNSHCATSCTGLMAVGGFRDSLSVSRDHRLITSGSPHPIAALHLDLLRPPSLI
jgi:hypothetical protein